MDILYRGRVKGSRVLARGSFTHQDTKYPTIAPPTYDILYYEGSKL